MFRVGGREGARDGWQVNPSVMEIAGSMDLSNSHLESPRSKAYRGLGPPEATIFTQMAQPSSELAAGEAEARFKAIRSCFASDSDRNVPSSRSVNRVGGWERGWGESGSHTVTVYKPVVCSLP